MATSCGRWVRASWHVRWWKHVSWPGVMRTLLIKPLNPQSSTLLTGTGISPHLQNISQFWWVKEREEEERKMSSNLETRSLLEELRDFEKGGLFDLGHPLLNRIAESFVKAAGVLLSLLFHLSPWNWISEVTWLFRICFTDWSHSGCVSWSLFHRHWRYVSFMGTVSVTVSHPSPFLTLMHVDVHQALGSNPQVVWQRSQLVAKSNGFRILEVRSFGNPWHLVLRKRKI